MHNMTLVEFQDFVSTTMDEIRQDLIIEKEVRTKCIMHKPEQGLGLVVMPNLPPGFSPLELVAMLVEKMEPDAVFFASEAWTTPRDVSTEEMRKFMEEHGGQASKHPKRLEAVVIIALTKQWQVAHQIIFERYDKDGNLVSGASAEETASIKILEDIPLGAIGGTIMGGRVLRAIPKIPMAEVPDKSEVGM